MIFSWLIWNGEVNDDDGPDILTVSVTTRAGMCICVTVRGGVSSFAWTRMRKKAGRPGPVPKALCCDAGWRSGLTKNQRHAEAVDVLVAAGTMSSVGTQMNAASSNASMMFRGGGCSAFQAAIVEDKEELKEV